VICTDKTGTLTQNRLGVNTVVLGGREYAADDHSVIEDPVAEYALQCVALCNAAELTDDGFSGDATDGALLQYADELADRHPTHDCDVPGAGVDRSSRLREGSARGGARHVRPHHVRRPDRAIDTTVP